MPDVVQITVVHVDRAALYPEPSSKRKPSRRRPAATGRRADPARGPVCNRSVHQHDLSAGVPGFAHAAATSASGIAGGADSGNLLLHR
jgi:hypothetical protein